MRITCATMLFLLLLMQSSKAGERAEYLIISDPHKISIFNKFEQSLTENEIKSLYSNTPFQILNSRETLGDQITEALRCSYQGETYFLLLDNKGRLKNSSASLYQKTFQKCLPINDSVQLKQSINVYERYPSSGAMVKCKPNQYVTRIFQFSTSFYIFIPEKKFYGWVNNSQGIFNTIKKATPQSTAIKVSDITDIVQARLGAVNQYYRQYFEYFNTITQQNKTIPMWKMEIDGNRVHCVLSSSAHITDQLQQSTRYVVQDIEQMLLGKPFTVQYTTKEIIINPR